MGLLLFVTYFEQKLSEAPQLFCTRHQFLSGIADHAPVLIELPVIFSARS